MKWRWILLSALPGAMVVPVLTQDAGALLRDQQRRQEQQRLQSGQPKLEQRLPESRQVQESGHTVEIRDIRFTGKIELLPEAERTRVIAEAHGQKLGVIGLQSLTGGITARLQQRGRLLARAILPPQDITEGVVEIPLRVLRCGTHLGQRNIDGGARAQRLRVQRVRPGGRWDRAALDVGVAERVRLSCVRIGQQSGSRPNHRANADGKTDRQQLWLQGAIRF